MKVTKLGHCCLLVEVAGKRILTDPGAWTTAQETIEHIDIVLITHEHQDHFHVPSVVAIKKNNPQAVILANTKICALLMDVGISASTISDAVVHNLGVSIRGFESSHEEIYNEIGMVTNMGFFIEETLYLPGDSLSIPDFKIRLLAAPMAGPWLTFKSAMRFIQQIHPRVAFPIHDGMIDLQKLQMLHALPAKLLEVDAITFTPLRDGEFLEF